MAIRRITAGEDFQTIINDADAGDYIQFKSGTHEAGIDSNDAMIYLAKSLNIELATGAILKLANGSASLHAPELAFNQLPVASITTQGTYTDTVSANFWVKVDANDTPDTFSWHKQLVDETGQPSPYDNTGVAITGDWQTLSDGIQIKFAATTGNTIGSGVIVCIGSTYYGIRVGTGFHADYIENVKIFGPGIINMNQTNNKDHSLHSVNLPSAILFHGRVRNMGVYGVDFQDIHRTVMAYGDHDGTYNTGGSVTGGTSYDAEFIDIIGTTADNTGAGRKAILIGHPEHRGLISYVRVQNNVTDCDGTNIEPNFNLYRYVVSGSTVTRRDGSSAGVIAAWRKSNNGIIANNTQIVSAVTMVTQNAPSGWASPSDVLEHNNVTV